MKSVLTKKGEDYFKQKEILEKKHGRFLTEKEHKALLKRLDKKWSKK